MHVCKVRLGASVDEKDVSRCLSCVLASSDALTVELNRLKHNERGIL